VTRIAELYASLRRRTSVECALSLPRRSLAVHSSSNELAAAAHRALTAGRIPGIETRSQPDDVCVVEYFSHAGFDIDAVGQLPSRSYHHETMGFFNAFDLEDGTAVVQPGRSALLCSATGEIVWLVADDILGGDPDRWPNLLDLAMVLIAESLRRGGCFLAHAGGVGRDGRCLLLVGESGAGKSTLALRKAIAGWDFYGDDMVIVGQDSDGSWRVYPFWRPVHLTPQSLMLLGNPRVRSPKFTVDNKVQCDIAELAPVQPPTSGLLQAVLCLQPARLPVVPERLDPADAMPALGAALLSGLNLQNTQHDLENLLELVTSTPVYRGSWDTDAQAIDALIQCEQPC
jgi:hypothetical protein